MSLFVSTAQKTPPSKAAFNLLLTTVLAIGVFWLALGRLGIVFHFSFVQDYAVRIRQGFGLTIALSLASLVLSLTIGVFSAVGQSSRILIIRYFCNGYVKIIRGTPLITQIYLFFYILGTAVGLDNRFWAGVFILSIFEGAYVAEIIRGSLLSIDETQLEASKAVGFNRTQTLRYVVFPQMVARTLPALTGQFASIIKDSSLLSIIAVIEITQTIREISATNYQLFSCYLFLGALYLCLTLPISFICRQLEGRFYYAN